VRTWSILPWIPCAAALTAAVLAVPSTATAAPKGRLIADANFASPSQGNDCITNEVSVFVRGGAGGNNAKLVLEISQTDDCKDEVLLTARGKANLGGGSFQVSSDLSGATLNANVTVTDRRQKKELVVTVRLTWVGVEEASAADVSVFPIEPGQFERLKTRVPRTLRLARASGVVSEGSNNLTPRPTSDSSISFEGSV
jgi:hypothetical protein